VLELYYEKENSMIIVRDIQDAMTMKKKLASLARRAHNYQKTRTTIIIELFELCEELEKNIEREEREMQAEVT
jgi:hypothetical protein